MADAIILTRPVSSSSVPIFGSEYAHVESLGVTTTTLTTFQEKLKLTTALIPAGTYRVGWNYQWNHNATNNDFEARIQLNDTTDIMIHQQEPKDSAADNGAIGPSPGPFSTTGTDQRYTSSGFVHLILASGTYDIDVDFRTNDTTDESSIWNAHLEFWRVV